MCVLILPLTPSSYLLLTHLSISFVCLFARTWSVLGTWAKFFCLYLAGSSGQPPFGCEGLVFAKGSAILVILMSPERIKMDRTGSSLHITEAAAYLWYVCSSCFEKMFVWFVFG